LRGGEDDDEDNVACFIVCSQQSSQRLTHPTGPCRAAGDIRPTARARTGHTGCVSSRAAARVRAGFTAYPARCDSKRRIFDVRPARGAGVPRAVLDCRRVCLSVTPGTANAPSIPLWRSTPALQRSSKRVTRRIFVERAYAVFARLPHPLLLGFAAIGHRIVEARHLRGIQRRTTAASAGRDVNESWRKTLLVCGILSSLLYGAMIAAIGYEGYSRMSQTPSELSAIGAPTQSLWMQLGAIYTVLVIAFGWGVWKSTGRDRPLQIVGGLLVLYGSLGLLWPFAPMHQREVLAAGGGTLSDTMHVVLASGTVLLMFVAMGVAARAFGTRFRLYSIASIVVLVAFGAMTFWDAPRVQANLRTPWIGLWERINISVFLLWAVVLAAVLWRVPAQRDAP
jgi:hypothetical protein